MPPFATEQEEFWAGEFGNAYAERNAGDAWVAANTAFFARVLDRTHDVTSVTELGSNTGLNLRALERLRPGVELNAVEINPAAAQALRDWGRCQVTEGSVVDLDPSRVQADLTFTKGVLIHINPDVLPQVYDNLVAASRRYVLVAEYYNPTPVTVAYRGHAERLFKRDFAGELMDRHGLSLVDYGFVWRRDPNFPQDDLTWFLLEKG